MRALALPGHWKSAGVLGLLLGVAYAVSPLSVWFVGLLAGIFVWAGHGLSERERRYVWAILALAVAIRVVAIAALFLQSEPGQLHSFPWDGDGVYIKYRAMVIRDVWMGIPVGAIDAFNALMPYYGWSSYINVLAYLNYLTGPAPYAVHLLNVLLFLAAATILCRLVRDAFGRLPAIGGWALMLFLPTSIAWSITALKESLCVFLFAVGLRALVAAVRGPGLALRLVGVAVVVGAIGSVNSVRVGAATILVVGLVGGLIGAIVVRRPVLLAGTVVCLPLVVFALWGRPAVSQPVMQQLNAAALYHRAAFMTEGDSYALLDERFYRPPLWRTDSIEMTPDEARRFVVRAFASFAALPLPWRVSSLWGVLMIPQQVLWYLMLPLAGIGCVVGLRRDALVTCVLAALALSGAAAFAINNGNVGTMVRFRDWIVPFVVWLSAVGASWVVVRLMPTVAASASRPGAEHERAPQAVFGGGHQIVSN